MPDTAEGAAAANEAPSSDHRIMELELAGTKFCMDPRIRHLLKEGGRLIWERHPENTHDSNAVAILVANPEGSPIRIGFVPARVAARLAPRLDSGCELEVIVVTPPLRLIDHAVTVRLDLDVTPKPAPGPMPG